MNTFAARIRLNKYFTGYFVGALLASLLLVAYAPMNAIVSAQTTAEIQKIQQLKQKATKEIDNRIKALENTLKKLNSDVRIDNIGLSASINDRNGQNASVAVAPETKKKAKELANKYITELKELKQKVNDTTSLTDMQSLAKAVDSQGTLTQGVTVQATVTKAIESMTGVFDKLKKSTNGLQSQVTKLKSCTGEQAAPSCAALDVKNEDAIAQAQAGLDNIKTVLTTIGSILLSVISIVLSLVTSMASMTGGLGSLSSLGDVSSMGGLGNLGGILSSFTAVSSQMDLAGGLSGNASGLLSSVSSITSMFKF